MVFGSRQLIPRVFGRDYWDVFDYPERLLGQDFGMDLTPFVRDPFLSDLDAWRKGLRRQLEPIQRELQQGLSSVRNDRDNFQVSLDVKHFKPEEVTVKYGDDGSVVIHGKHEERSDEHGHISREFTRRYVLPENVQQEKVTCNWDPNGVLTITAPKMVKQLPAPNERTIPINQSGEQQQAIGQGQQQTRQQ